MKIILLCYKLSPNRGSEYAVAWNFLRRMFPYHEFFVLYGNDGTADNRDMNSWILSHPNENIHYYKVELPQTRYANFTKWLYKKEKYSGFFLMYNLWHKETYKVAKKISKQYDIDIIHYLNPIGFKEPGYLWKVNNIPYIWGPIQGVHNWPLPLYKAISWKGKKEALYRLFAHNAVLLFSLKIRRAVKRADYIFGVSRQTINQFKTLFGKDLEYLPENGITQMMTEQPIKKEPHSPLNIIWVGKFEDRKCIHLLLMALGKLKNENWILTVCAGGGKLDVVSQIKALGIEQKVILKGKVSREEVQECFRNSHLHVISSLQDATTTVLFEAMSWGVPTMTLDHCGMGMVVCEKCGIKIPITSYSQVIDDIATAIHDLIRNPQKVQQLSEGVLECSKQYLWDARVQRFNRVYELVAKKKD